MLWVENPQSGKNSLKEVLIKWVPLYKNDRNFLWIFIEPLRISHNYFNQFTSLEVP